MFKARIILIIGIWVTVLSYLGFPYAWKDVLFTGSGLLLILISFLMYKELSPKESSGRETFDNFSENNFEENSENPESENLERDNI